MRSLAFAAVAGLLLVAFPVSAETPYNCHPGFSPRTRPAIQAQIDRFLRTGGDVEDFCVGPCDPE